MANEWPPVRRIVVGTNDAGKSVFLEDGPAPCRFNPARPEARNYRIWGTGPAPVPVDDIDRSPEATTIMPPVGGTVLRIVEFDSEPLDPVEQEKFLARQRDQHRDDLTQPQRGIRRHPDAVHPAMHETDTVDYALIMSGEIYAVMDTEERLMRQGDVLVQRGNRHSWSNRSGAPCRVAFVLIEGTPIRS